MLSAPSPGNDLRLKLAIRLRSQTVRGDSFWEIDCDFDSGNDTVAVAMHFAMKIGQICFSLRKFLAISSAIQKIASDCGCDAVVHLGLVRTGFFSSHTQEMRNDPDSENQSSGSQQRLVTDPPPLSDFRITEKGVAPANQAKERAKTKSS